LRVYFGVCGIGLGHAGRCIPMAEKLVDRGAEVLFSTYTDGIKYVEQAGFPVVEAPAVGFVVKADGTVDFRQTVANPGPILASFTLTKQVEAEIKFIRSFKPDVVVSDSRVSPLLAAKMLDVPDVCILNQFQIIIPRRSRLLRLAKLVDTGALAMIGKLWTIGVTHLMIPDFPPPYVLSYGNLRIPKAYQKRVKLIGPILPVHPDDLPSEKELRSRLGLDADSKLVYLPISGPSEERAYITGLLRQIVLDLPENYHVVMSLGYPRTSVKPVHKGNVSIYGWVSNRFEYLKACDLVVSRAGHGTLTQSICFGKPMVLIPTPSHTEQVNNALRVKELGIAEVLEQGDVSRDTLAEVIDRMLADQSCQRRVKEIQKDVSGLNGLRTAVETIMQVAQNS
jgi:UDP-N-acetylglucosamine--N-acetylmuramyl-(pentapeptide) pyrophosphoryl-undecaprenol N-acetylglucosamine transferase